MEISDLVNTIEGLTEEQAVEIVARAEVLAEEQTEELPRRKGSRGRRRVSRPPSVESADLGDSEVAALLSETESQGDEEFVDVDTDLASASDLDAIAEGGSALPTEPTAAVAGEPSSDDSTDPERDEASEAEIHDVALAVETSSYSPQGHEVTSPPSENDQGEGIRIVTEAVEQTAPKRGSGASTPISRADRAPESTGGRSGDES